MPLVLGLRYPLAGLRAMRKPSIGVLDETRLSMRVRPSDCDVLMHVNNGRYLSLMDIGRINHAGRCGMIGLWRRTGWKPVAGGATIRFRRELRLGAKYTLRTRCVGFDEGWSFWEQVFERADGKLAARAYAKVAMLDTDGSRLKSERVLEALGADPESPPLPEGVLAWQASDFG